MMISQRGLLLSGLIFSTVVSVHADDISGIVTDEKTNEPLIGATIEVAGTSFKTVSDADGKFLLTGLKHGKYNITIKYIAYQSCTLTGVEAQKDASSNVISVKLKADEQTLEGVSVTAVQRKNTERAMVLETKKSDVIVSNISAQEIKATQDNNASEVIRRVPGVSLIDDKFVMVRGLSQRYNNVWMNGGAVPSSEADSRAFSFDIVPSGQIDNLTIVKTPTAEYPSDFTGGFIMINTKEIPSENSYNISAGLSYNNEAHFQSFLLNRRNSQWYTKKSTPWGDWKASADMAHRWNLSGRKLGMIAAVNYSNEYRTNHSMQNNLFGLYDVSHDQPNYLRHSTDDQYNLNTRLGAMVNFTLLSKDGNSKYELKNIFNRLTNTRYTWRDGISAQSNLEKSAEYYYRSRTVYNGQLTGKHTFSGDALDWSVGYAYANRRLPDRRRYLTDDALESGKFALTTGNDISREWTKLNEHIISANVNNVYDMKLGSWVPKLHTGLYGEYRSRNYTTKEYIYNWNANDNNLPSGFRYIDIPTLLSDDQYSGEDKLYMLELSKWRNNYRGKNTLGAGYVSLSMPFGALNVLAGVRFEHNDMELISNTRDTEKSETSRHYKGDDFFPSLNATYRFNTHHQLRFGYGRSVNRPEFREVSSSVFYDFDLASSVQGNTELKNCYIDNLDLRYEFYPTDGEIISLAAFYKHFKDPIEWTYTVTGGTDLVYSFKNAHVANNYGLELDIRKRLDFIGLRNFSLSFNGSLIKSRVKFPVGSHEENRPMQGQSPYLINTGLFYRHPTKGLSFAVLYNRIGKRIIGVGRSEGSTGEEENARIPDSYEMPRDMIDLSATKTFGNHWELKLNVRDLLAQHVVYKQFADVTYADGSKRTIDEITRKYRPGRNIGLILTYKF